MIYQVKGISGYVWDMHGCVLVCVGVLGCARVCSGVRGCAWSCTGARKCTYMYVGVIGCVRVGGCGMRGCAWVCVVVCESARVSASVCVG